MTNCIKQHSSVIQNMLEIPSMQLNIYEKEVDELIILDIEATNNQQEPNYKLLQEIASESFIP